jgi:hypothetical protein
VHDVTVEFDLSTFPFEPIPAFGFIGQNAGVVEQDAMKA